MADVSAALKDWSATSASNSPSGGATIGTGLDDNLREIQGAIVRGLSYKGADIASASTTDLGAIEGLAHDITGTTTITSFGTVRAGIWKIIKFEGALTLTHNATSLILPGAANITTADGDIAIVISEGSGNWRCVSYVKASGTSVKSEWTLATAVATTSGTTKDFTSLPANISEIIVILNANSTNGSSNYLVQLGTSGGMVSSSYASQAWQGGSGDTAATSTSGFVLTAVNGAATAVSGIVSIKRITANKWVSSGQVNRESDGVGAGSSGRKDLGAELTQLRFTTVSADTFDNGDVNILYRVA